MNPGQVLALKKRLPDQKPAGEPIYRNRASASAAAQEEMHRMQKLLQEQERRVVRSR